MASVPSRSIVLFVFVCAACGGNRTHSGSTSPGSTTGTGGSATGSSGGHGGSGGNGGAPAGPPPGNAAVLDDGSVMPLYPVSASNAATRAVGFVQTGTMVAARDEHGALLWEKDLGPGSLFGGFDFDADGFPDLGLVRSQDTGMPCGAQTILMTSLDVATGRAGALYNLVPPLASLCWMFPTATYPTTQWSDLGILFGAGTAVLATSPYYATSGTFWHWNGTGFDALGTYQYPSTDAYDAAYPGAHPNAYGQGHAYVQNSHVANGLFASVASEDRLAFFTSSRFVEYAVAPLSASQLRVDTPYLTANRTDIAGRDYGLVAPDPGQPDHIVLLGGTDASTLYSDMLAAAMVSDPWGQIERHVSIMDLVTGTVDDRFFSYAHDGGDAYKYEGRVVYPAGPFVKRGAGQPSRLAFNVYEGGHWQLHVTAPGTTADAVVLPDAFLWDVRDLDGDGQDEWVISPSRDPSDPNVPGYYFCKWRTKISRWDEATTTLADVATIEGAIPLLVPTFRLPSRSTSRSYLYPSLTARVGGSLVLLLEDASQKRVSYTIGP
jgi:hypothetical protein